MRVLFDTSGVNRLFHDAEANHILSGIEAVGQTWVSALTVVEASKISDPELRVRMLEFLCRMSRGRRPLEMPDALLRRAMAAHARNDQDIVYSVEGDNEIAWLILNSPNELTSIEQKAAYNALRAEEACFREHHAGARPTFQAAFARGEPRPPSAAATLRAYCANDEFLHNTVAPLYSRETGIEISVADVRTLLNAIPELKAYLVAWAHSVHARAVSAEGYGRHNAGIIDLQFAVYVPRLTWFVTADRKQFQALRFASRFFSPRCRVLRYGEFRQALVIGP